jgi:hypothetical protein
MAPIVKLTRCVHFGRSVVRLAVELSFSSRTVSF